MTEYSAYNVNGRSRIVKPPLTDAPNLDEILNVFVGGLGHD